MREAERAEIEALQQLSKDTGATSVAKLVALARRQHLPVSTRTAQEALRTSVARQVFAPGPRSLGISAAEGPHQRLQADLIDFRKNATRGLAGEHYVLAVEDVFTRQLYTK